MRAFISYASEDRDRAREIAKSLVARGHTAFFDREGLRPGETYEDKIQDEIARSEFMVFLISPDSLKDGRYTRTELRFAKMKWPRANNRVLPVMIRPAKLEDVPTYLRTVTVLEPEGDAGAEVAAAVTYIARRPARIASRVATGVVIAAAVAGAVYWIVWGEPQPAFAVDAGPPVAAERGFFREPDEYALPVRVANEGRASGTVLRIRLEAEPADAISVLQGDEVQPTVVPPAGALTRALRFAGNVGTARLRGCAEPATLPKVCSQYMEVDTSARAPFADAMPLDPDVARTATAVAWEGSAFLVGTTENVAASDTSGTVDPDRTHDRLLRIDQDGTVVKEVALDGVPTAISVGPLGTFVGLAAPVDRIIRINPKTLETLVKGNVNFANGSINGYGNPISLRPSDLAQTNSHVWVLTSGGAASAGIGYFDPELKTLKKPTYYEDVSFDLNGFRLRSGANAVWSGESNSTPASVHRLTAEKHVEFSGHDFEAVSCASDVIELNAEIIAVPNCMGMVQTLKVTDTILSLQREIGRLAGYTPSSTWDIASLAATPDNALLGGLTARLSQPREVPERTSVDLALLPAARSTDRIFSMEGGRIADLAVGTTVALVLLKEVGGVARELVATGLRQ